MCVAAVVVVSDMLLAVLKRLFNSSAFSHPMALYHVRFFLSYHCLRTCAVEAHTLIRAL